MFLTTEDFKKIISFDNFTQITANNPTLLMDMAEVAVDEALGYLSRYDTAATFAAEGDERHKLLVVRCLDIATYHVYTQFMPKNIPDIRRDRYAEAISWLKGLSKGTIDISLPLKEVAGQTGFFLYGGNKPFNVR